ncbi:hypothetical protein IW148_000421 [Coemansia sp. RSA 1199]|nr:hypothetical protein IW148_000421 [Coemansia sp. RSA 1199]
MFQQTHYYRTPVGGQMYLEVVPVTGRPGPAMPSTQGGSPYASYSALRTSHTMSSRSPAGARYSPGASLTSEGTVGDFSNDIPKSPSLASSKTASPPPAMPQTMARKPRRRGARSQFSAEEKEMRRKISHSAIEKRRRERTNNVLHDLQHMVPWLSKSSKVQKLEILEAAAHYISQLRGDPESPASDDTAEDSGRSPMKLNFLLS